jgi:hypothetical protein
MVADAGVSFHYGEEYYTWQASWESVAGSASYCMF